MSHEKVKDIEKYLRSIKKKTPSDVNFARLHLMLLKDEIGEEELLNIKILYQSRLGGSPYTANYLAIVATLVSIIIFMLSTLTPLSKVNMMFIGIITLILVTLMTYINFTNGKSAQANITCTIIVNLIDEIIEKSPKN